uniref:Uncharacterized protein n=1 Tax=Anopheles culicifacies TaxID=139723 RepID=A0A182M8E4_9DIPT
MELETQALALTRSKSPKKDSSMPVSPSHTAERDTEMSSPKAISGTAASSSSVSSNSSTADPPADRSQSADVNGSSNHHLPAPSSNGAAGSSTNAPPTGQSRVELATNLHPAITVSQSLLAAAATVNRSITPRISVSSSLTAPENNGPGPNGPGGRDSNPVNGPPHIDRTILQSPVAAVAAAAAAMQDRKQDFDFSKVNASGITGDHGDHHHHHHYPSSTMTMGRYRGKPYSNA